LIPTAALSYLQMGNVNVALSANLLLGSLPGVFISSNDSHTSILCFDVRGSAPSTKGLHRML
jgi:hypothetical protein